MLPFLKPRSRPLWPVSQLSSTVTGLGQGVQVVNLFTSPLDFSNAAWTKDNITVVNAGLSTQSILETAATTTHGARQSITKAAAAITYRVQFDVAPGLGRDWFMIEAFPGDFLSGVSTSFNVTTGALGTSSAFGTYATTGVLSITSIGGGYYRCIRDFTTNADTTLNVFAEAASADNTATYLGDIAKGLFITNALLYAL